MKNLIMIKFILITSIMAQSYDIVINGGRVMDPETGFDGIRNVGIRGDRIVEITSKSISGKVAVNAKGLVVSPGFIDLHAHGKPMMPINTKLEMVLPRH